MFSTRLDWGLQPNRVSKLLAEKRTAGVQILDLTESNPTRAELLYPEQEILTAIADPHSLRYDPVPAGLTTAREAVAAYYSGCVDPGRIILTASTSEAYAFVFKLLADPGDEVLVPRPSYPLFEFLAGLEGLRVVQYPLVYHEGWAIDFEAFRALAGEKTRAIVVVNPNNPTGSFLKRAELDRLVAFCAERDFAIISDEVFADFSLTADPQRVPSLTQTHEVATFSLSGLSKVAGLPQMKLGWIVAGGPPAIRAQAMERLELIADTYLSVSAPVQWAAQHLLALRQSLQVQISRRVRDNLEFLQQQTGRNSPCSTLNVEGGWYAIIQAPRIRSEEEWVLRLLEENVLVQPGFFFDFLTEAFLVVSLLTAPEIFREGISRLMRLAR